MRPIPPRRRPDRSPPAPRARSSRRWSPGCEALENRQLLATVIDNGSEGYVEVGEWGNWGTGYGGSHRFGEGISKSASWTSPTLPAGTYTVQATWEAATSHTQATYQIYVGTTLLRESSVDHRITPQADVLVESHPFQTIATVVSTGGPLRVVLLGGVGGAVNADAIRIAPAAPTPTAPILDNGGEGYVEVGEWGNWGTGYGGSHRFGDGISKSASWTSPTLPAGTYTVQATWQGATSHTQATYQIYAGTTLLRESSADHRIEPQADTTVESHPFQTIATVVSTGGPLRVVLLGGVGGAVNADAIRIAPAAPTITLSAIVRDFRIDHPDFEVPGTGLVTGLVAATLGPDRKPVLAGAGNLGAITNASTFDQWYRDTPGVNLATALSFTLVDSGDGIYRYIDTSYFPIDGRLFGDEGNPSNYHFTTELHARFTYRGGETFDFLGDDDVWVFIDDRLVVDLGGVHAAEPGSVDLDTLGLVVGRSYAFDLFHAERHVVASNLIFETSLELEQLSIPTGSLAGSVYLDADDDGRKDAGEAGLGGVVVTLTGVPDVGGAITATTRTSRDGSYRFEHLQPGTYALIETPPAGYLDAKDSLGNRGGTSASKRFSAIALADSAEGRGYNFGHQRAPEFTSTPIAETGLSSKPSQPTIIHPYEYRARADDADGDALRYTLLIGPEGMAVHPDTGMVTWTTDSGDLGAHDVVLRVEDLRGGSDEQRYTLTVAPEQINRPPYFATEPIVDAWVATLYAYPTVALDPDLDALTFTKLAGPAGLGVDPGTGLVTWTPTTFDLGPHPVTLKVEDGRGGEATLRYTIVVAPTPGNRPPIIVSTPVDKYRVPAATPPGTTLTLSTIVRDFRIEHPDFEYIEPGYSGFVTGLVRDTLGADRKPVFIGHDKFGSITDTSSFNQWYRDTPGVNRTTSSPLVLEDSGDGVYRFSDWTYFPIDGQLFGNEGNANNFHFTMELHARFTYQGDETLEFWGDDDTWLFIDHRLVIDHGGIHDWAEGSANLASLGLVVGRSYAFDLYHAERHTTGSYFSIETSLELEQGEGYRYDVDAIDPDGDPITYELIPTPGATPQPPPAEMTIDPDTGVIGWTQRDIAPGAYPVTVRARDDRGGYSVPQSYTIIVSAHAGNLPPVIRPAPDPIRVVAGERFTYTVRADDPDGDPVTLQLVDGPGDMTFDPATGLLDWTPGLADVGAEPKNILISAGDGRPNGQTSLVIHVMVTRLQNADPVLAPIADQAAEVGAPFSYLAVATDPDHDPLEFDLPVRPPGMVVDRTRGRLFWYPSPDQAGLTSDVILRAGDGLGGVALRAFRVTVAMPNHAPLFPGSLIAQSTAGRTFAYEARAVDPDGDPLAYGLEGNYPAGLGFADPARPGLLSWPSAVLGTYQFVITAADGRGGVGKQNVELVIVPDATNNNPIITSDYRKTIQLGRTYLYQVTATDPDHDRLTYSLVGPPVGMAIDPASGLLTWTPTVTPTLNPFGPHSFLVRVADGRGIPVDQPVGIEVVAQATNGDPIIAASLPKSAVVGRPYEFRLTGSDPDFDPLFWSFSADSQGAASAPAGMVIDPRLGTVAWRPTADQLGPHAVTVRLDDGQGGWTTRAYTVTVRGGNLPPQLGEMTPPEAVLGVAYALQVVATDPEGDDLDYDLVGARPADLAIDASGLIRWQSPGPLDAAQLVTVRVTDTAGDFATATFEIRVRATATNRPPRITSDDPPYDAVVGQEYQYQVSAVDDDGPAPITFDVRDRPAGMTIDPNTGLIRWTPSGPTSARIAVVVADGLGASRTRGYTIAARTNQPPTLEPIPAATVARGASFRHDVQASDPDAGDTLRYTLTGARWLAIDSAGRIIGTPDASVAFGTHTFQVRAFDRADASSPTRTLTVTVAADTSKPTVQVHFAGPDGDRVKIGQTATIVVTAADDVGVAALTLTVGGTPVRLDGHGAATVTFNAANDYAVVATATDAAGNASTPATATLRVIDPSVTSRPTATILAPGDQPVTVITAPTQVRFTVADANLVAYALAYAPLDTDDWTTLDTANVPVTDRAVTFDPTILANGYYSLRLTARNAGGHEAVDERVIGVEGNLKLGNLRMSFVDLAIPVAGIPITITRTYDSLNSKVDGDFGHGWKLEEAGFRVDVSQPDGTLRRANIHQSFHAGTRVVITRPGRKAEVFVFLPVPIQSGYFVLNQYYKPRFVPAPGTTSTLSVDDVELTRVGDEFFALIDHTPYNPADSVANPSQGYTLKARDGSEYVFHAGTGQIASVIDRVGRTLTFDDRGISSDTGRAVTFVRELGTNRISKIVDEQTGNEVVYTYDAKGDLRSVAAPFDGPETSTTQYIYDTARPHFLKQVIDPLGRTAATTHFDANGRIERVVDADGKETHYAWNSGTLVQRVTDQLGATTVLTLDDRGNVLRTVDPEGGISKLTYDGDDRPLVQTIVIGLEDAPGGETNDLVTTSTYRDGNRASVTDPRGNLTLFAHNAFGQPTGVVTADGATTSEYDNYGLIRRTEDANGNATLFDHDRRGNLFAINDDDGHRLASFTYNTYGEATGTTPAAGRASSLDYDADGNVVARWTFDGVGAAQVQVLDVTRYDDAGRVVATIHAVLPAGQFITANLAGTAIPEAYVRRRTATTYNKAGQVLTQTDQLGRETRHAYDLRGQPIEVRTQAKDQNGGTVWQVSRTVYDAAGRVVVATDPYLEGTPEASITGSRTVYDKAGRAQRTERLRGVRVDLVGTGTLLRSVVGAAGAVVTASGTIYDKAGRVESSTDADGLETRSVYNRFGETVETRTRSYDQAGAPVWLVSRTVYDARGRAILATDPYVEGSAEPVHATRTAYDVLGRAHRSARLRGVQVGLVGVETALVNEGTELWRTATIFDDEGRVQRTVAADGQTTDYEYDHLGRRTATIGHPVVFNAQTLRLRSETVYDDLGRVSQERTNLHQRADGTVDASQVRVTASSYDESDRVIRTTFADGTTIGAAYDQLGRKVSETNQLGLTRTFTHDPLTGRLTRVELPAVADPLNNGTMTRPRYEYGYDAQGNQTLIRDPLGRETRFTFDAEGRQLTRTLPLGFGPDGKRGTGDDANLPEGVFAERFEYDPRGRQVLHVSFEGIVAKSVYSPLTGRLSRHEFYATEAAYNGGASPAETWTYTYDAFGRTLRVDQARGTTARTTTTAYDAEGRVTRVATPEGAVNYRHDDLGRLVRTFTTSATGAEPIDDTRYTYDALGRLATVTVVEQNDVAPPEADRQVTTHAYDMLGNLAWQIRPDGVVAEYLYDRMNRLDKLSYHEPGWFSGYPSLPYRVLASYDYAVRADGRRAGVAETVRFDDDGDGSVDDHTTATLWTYDGLGRLVTESIDHYVNALDRVEHFVYDLTGNRLKQVVDKGRDGSATPDEVTTYIYDANDRLTIENLDTTGDNQPERTTTYGYGHTQQALKEVRESGALTGRTTFGYDLQGRMQTVTASTYAAGTASRVERTTYGYGADGIRTSAVHEVDSTADGAFETRTRTEYLNDDQNATGYAQALRETTVDAVTELVRKVIVYAIGHDQISQTVTEYSAGQPGTPTTLVLGSDGHGSTRFLTDLLGAIATVGVRQLFDYDAYGNLLNIDAAEAATNILYSGEMFDSRIGRQNLRGRWYDPATGRFDRLDPFFGNLQDPQSLHKYTYAHSEPVNNLDPSGLMILSSINVSISSGISFLSNFTVRFILPGLGHLGKGLVRAWGAFTYVGTVSEFRNQLLKRSEFGQGGYSADRSLLAVRNSVISQWSRLTQSQKQKNIDTLHGLSSGLGAWDINQLTFRDKKSWTAGILGDVAEETLTYRGKVYPVAEVNYLLWGLVNALAYNDKISVDKTNFRDVQAKVIAYRVGLGGGIISKQWTDHLFDDGEDPPSFETTSGKIAWTSYGWEWAVNVNPLVPTDEALTNAQPNYTPWPRFMTFHAGGGIGGIVP